MGPHPSLFEMVFEAITKVTALLTAATAFVAIVFAVPRELKKWRSQKLAEKKAEIAAAALVASIDLLQAMDVASVPVNLKGDPEKKDGQPYVDFMRTWFGARTERLQPQLDALGRIRIQAHVYLSKEQNEALEAVSKHVTHVFGEFMTWVTFMGDQSLRREASNAFKNVFGSAPTQARQELRQLVTEQLRPSAHLSDLT